MTKKKIIKTTSTTWNMEMRGTLPYAFAISVVLGKWK
jgi:hypothetical protein